MENLHFNKITIILLVKFEKFCLKAWLVGQENLQGHIFFKKVFPSPLSTAGMKPRNLSFFILSGDSEAQLKLTD